MSMVVNIDTFDSRIDGLSLNSLGEFSGMNRALFYQRKKNMIRVNFVAIGRCPKLGGAGPGDENSYILESSWGSEALLSHFFGLLGLREKPAREQRLNSARF